MPLDKGSWSVLVDLCESLLLDSDGLTRCQAGSRRATVLQMRYEYTLQEIEKLQPRTYERAGAVNQAQHELAARR